MVARFEEDTPFNKMKEIESLLRATPFGEKENGSNGSLYLLLATRISARKIVSLINGDRLVEI